VPDEGAVVLLPGGHDAGILSRGSYENTVKMWEVDIGN